MKKLEIFLINNNILVILFFTILVFSMVSPFFFELRNITNILRQASLLAIIGMAQTLVILTGGIDLSVGSNIALSTVIVGPMLLTDIPFIIPVVLILLIGAGFGLVNGLIITKLKLPPFIVTYSTMFVARGLAWLSTGGHVVYQLKPNFRFLGTGAIFGLETPTFFCIAIFFILSFILNKTIFGRKIYFVGANEKAALFSGILKDDVLLKVYTLCGLITSFAGILYVSRLNAVEPGIGELFNLNSIAVVLIGGTAISGGVGGLLGTWIGAILIAIIQNGMNLLQVPSELQTVYLGILIIVAVLINTYTDLYKRSLGL